MAAINPHFKTASPEEMKRIAAKGGAASGPGKRKANARRKLIAEVIRELLATPTKDGGTVLEDITKAILNRMLDSGTPRDLATLADILGEMVQKVEARTAQMPTIDIEVLGGDDRPELAAAENLAEVAKIIEKEGNADK